MTGDDAAQAMLARAVLAAALLAVDPARLGGLHLRARAGPLRDRVAALTGAVERPARRLHPGIDDTQLYGGLDLSATLAGAGPVRQAGLLTGAPAALTLTMAERCPPDLAARLALALDAGSGHVLILLDEGAAPDEIAPPALRDRLAFAVDLDGIGARSALPDMPRASELSAARDRLAGVKTGDEVVGALVVAAARLGIDSPRAPILALAAARAHAALAARDSVADEDLRAAVELVYPSRATILPRDDAAQDDTPEEDRPEPPDDRTDPDPQDDGETPPLPDRLPEEMLVDAAAALLPPDLLDRLAAQRASRGAAGSGAGAARKGNRRGRPLPSRAGRADGRARIDLVATLRAAAPWQTIRARARPGHAGLHMRASDIRLRRFEDRSDRLVIFVVDASGSAAMARLSEAKGAVELLLGEAYARRDHVALVAFRGTQAEELLPPTRSLVQTKRRLAGLPGGGPTPLADGLRAAAGVAARAAAHGLTPTLALLTDGRANIALDGKADRAAAASDAADWARAVRSSGIPALVLDTAARPQAALERLAAEMGASYQPLPRADARRIGAAVSDALGK